MAPDGAAVSSRSRAAAAARQGDPRMATMWALVAIADELALLRRGVDTLVRQGARRG